MYITPAQLAESPGASELAQVASSEHAAATVTAALMDLTLRGGDRSAYSAGDIADADEALTRIEAAIEWTGEYIDGFLRRRLTLPLSSVPLILLRVARQLVRYDLHKHLISDDKHPVLRDYRAAEKLLESIRDGKVAIGAEDPSAATTSGLGDVRFESSAPVFARTGGAR